MSAYRTPEQWREPTPQEELGGGIVDPNRPNVPQLPSYYRLKTPEQAERSKYYQQEFGLAHDHGPKTPNEVVAREQGIAACRAVINEQQERQSNNGETLDEKAAREAKEERQRIERLEIQKRTTSDYWDALEKGVPQLDLDWSDKNRD